MFFFLTDLPPFIFRLLLFFSLLIEVQNAEIIIYLECFLMTVLDYSSMNQSSTASVYSQFSVMLNKFVTFWLCEVND